MRPLKLNVLAPPAVDALALVAALVLPFRGGTRTRSHFDGPLTQCVCALLFVVLAANTIGWTGYLHQLAVLVLPVLATHSDGFSIFVATNLLGIHSVLQGSDHGIWVSAAVVGMHTYLLLAGLSAQGWSALHQAMEAIGYAKERQLIRLNRLRGLVLDDIWRLPDRLHLRLSHSEFRYDSKKPLFIIRAIIGMTWRPLLPLFLLKSSYEIMTVSQTVIFGRLLRCVDEPAKHEWYECYWLLLSYMALRLLQSQHGRLESMTRAEEKRVIDAVGLELFRLPLSNSGLESKGNRQYYKFMARNLIIYLTRAYSQASSIASAAFTIWLIYRNIGWVVATPMLVSVVLAVLEWGISVIDTSSYYRDGYYVPSSIIDEVYFGIKSIKFYGWERRYYDPEIMNYDKRKGANKHWYARAARAASYAVNVLQHVSRDISVYFTIVLHLKTSASISNAELLLLVEHINSMRHHVSVVYRGFCSIAGAFENNRDLESALRGDSVDVLPRSKEPTESGPSIKLDDCSFARRKKRAVLMNITLSAGNSELVAVIGKVASGKSSLLLAMCSEVEMTEGSGQVHGTIGYVEQSPWIMNGTLRDNITFGRAFDEDLYWRVVHACALISDIDTWPERDLTEIGDRGINISGGQKARLALARAVYSQADIYILDDPLSAVDEQVKRHLLDNVIMDTGILGNKLRIVSTNSDHILPFSNQIVRLKNNTARVEIQQPKDYSEISRRPFRVQSPGSESSDSAASDATVVGTAPDKRAKPKPSGKPKESNGIDGECLTYLARLCGAPVLAVILLPALLRPVVEFIADSFQLDALKANSRSTDNAAVLAYLAASLLSEVTVHIIWTTERFVEKNITEKYMSERMNAMFLRGLLHAPTEFYDSTNKQEIISAYSDCCGSLARGVPHFVKNEASGLLSTMLACYRIATKAPQLLLLAPLLAYLLHLAAQWTTPTEKAVKDIRTRSDIHQMRVVDTIIDGQRSIRLLGVGDYFVNQYTGGVDRKARLSQPREALGSLSATVYSATRTASSFVVLLIMLLQLQWTPLKLTSGDFKRCERLVHELSGRLINVVSLRGRVSRYCDNVLVLQKYTEMEPEGSRNAAHASLPSEWPSAGKIEFCNFSMRYSDGLDLSLKDISLTINPGEKIGIVGRTGAGKSSLTRALFRIYEGASGSILVDGEDISKFDLAEMRPRIGIIPQDSALFQGSVRRNLDPLREFTIEDMWAALIKCSMASIISPKRKPPAKPKAGVSSASGDDDSNGGDEDDGEERAQKERWEKAGWLLRLVILAFDRRARRLKPSPMRNVGLRKHVLYGGRGFSAGQRQLFSLCRALMRKRKILVLDEATADVDLETDKAIHDVIHKEFKDCTVLTIAHRLDTVMNSDRIIVMDQGRVAEFDTPKNLIAKGGLFAQLVETNSIGK